jgi:predicted RNase H-like HicB family nuclease
MNDEYRYEIVIYWSEPDQGFVAEVPELAGCMADGTTRGDALRNVETAISEWIETARAIGREIPKPKGRLLHAWLFAEEVQRRNSLRSPRNHRIHLRHRRAGR